MIVIGRRRAVRGPDGQGADHDEREGLAMRAAQMPLRFCRDSRRDADRHREQRLHIDEVRLGRGLQPTKIAHAVLAWRRHVLQV